MAQIRLVPPAVAGSFAWLVLACGGSDKQAVAPAQSQCPPGQYFDGQICQSTTGTAGQPGAPAPQPTVTSTGTVPPIAPPIATSAAGAQAQPLDAASLAAITPLITPLAQQSAPGGKNVGTIGGNFQQGQILELQVQMNPGKCYTMVGAAVPTVTNLDIELVPLMPVPGITSPIMASDQSQGPTAIVGAAPNCFKWAWPVGGPMKVVLRVSAGQGMAGAQVFEK